MSEKLVVVVQARAGGSRMPGKVLALLLGQPMLLHLLDRLSRIQTPHTLVVACPADSANAEIQRLCWKHGYACELCEVPENDVLGRYAMVAEKYDAAHVVRLTADTPLIDHAIVDACIQKYGDYRRWSWEVSMWESRMMNDKDPRPLFGDYDHVGIAAEWPDGQDVECFSRNALEIANAEATLPSDREHVSSFMWRQPKRFRCATLPCPFGLASQQYSVDTREDLCMVERILALSVDIVPGWREIARIIRDDHELLGWQQRRAQRNGAYVAQVAQEQGLTDSLSWESIRYGA